MSDPVQLYGPATSEVRTGGLAVTVAFGPIIDGFITNPLNAADQGLAVSESLWVDVVGPATLGTSSTSVEIVPGATYTFVPDATTNISVNAASSGHRFSAVVYQPSVTPEPNVGPFPPAGPTTLLKIIKSYLYQEYSDDEDLQSFVDAYNDLAQRYIDWFATINLPVYTGAQISGALLDWVALGLYGMPRPVLASGRNKNKGPYNTAQFNSLRFNATKMIGPTDYFATSDDIFKRIMTWNFYKGDGRTFDVRWLKRRVMRFILGPNGTAPNVDQTYQVSVTFGVGGQVSITLINGIRTRTGGARFGGFQFNRAQFNGMKSTFAALPQLPNAIYLQEAVASGAVQLPFQFSFVVVIGPIWTP